MNRRLNDQPDPDAPDPGPLDLPPQPCAEPIVDLDDLDDDDGEGKNDDEAHA